MTLASMGSHIHVCIPTHRYTHVQLKKMTLCKNDLDTSAWPSFCLVHPGICPPPVTRCPCTPRRTSLPGLSSLSKITSAVLGCPLFFINLELACCLSPSEASLPCRSEYLSPSIPAIFEFFPQTSAVFWTCPLLESCAALRSRWGNFTCYYFLI